MVLEAQYTVLDARLILTSVRLDSHRARLEQTVPEDAEGDHLVKNAAEMVAAMHVLLMAT